MLPLLAQSSDLAAYGPLPAILFYIFAAVTVAGAFAVALSRNIIRAAVALLFALAGMSGFYFLLHAEFLAAVQLVVYVGGTLILIIFGVMLTHRSPDNTYDPHPFEVFGASILATAIGIPLIYLFLVIPWHRTAAAAGPTVQQIGLALLSSAGYLIPFEIISILLLAVMIGAAYLARPRRAPAPPAPSAPPASPGPAALQEVRS